MNEFPQGYKNSKLFEYALGMLPAKKRGLQGARWRAAKRSNFCSHIQRLAPEKLGTVMLA
jgi:hypothetical protein